MKIKTVVTVVLLAFVAASVVNLLVGEVGSKVDRQSSEIAQLPSPSNTNPIGDGQVVVYYFHGRARCSNCIKFEAYSKETIKEGFSDALGDGRLVLQVLNVEEPENVHFVEDFQLITRSVVVVKMKGNQQLEWKNLKRIWELVGNKEAFKQYIHDEVTAYLGGGV